MNRTRRIGSVVTVVTVVTVVAAAVALTLVDGPLASSAAAPAANASGSDYAHAAGATTWPEPGRRGSMGTARRRSGRSSMHRPGSPRTRLVTCSSPMPVTAGCERSRRGVGRPVRDLHAFGPHGDHRRRPVPDTKADPPPTAVAVDAAGDLFIAFGSANRVEELRGDQSAVRTKLVTVAGTGTPGFSGDGRPAVTSQLDDPSGLAVDPAGDLLIADTANCRLRVVAATAGTRFGMPVTPGNIYTVAGNGTCGSAGTVARRCGRALGPGGAGRGRRW